MYEKVLYYIVKILANGMRAHSVSDEQNYTHVMISRGMWERITHNQPTIKLCNKAISGIRKLAQKVSEVKNE